MSLRVNTSGCATFSDVYRVDLGLHFHCFSNRAYFHFAVDRHRDIRRHLDLLLHRIESRHREGDGVSAGSDVDDGVATLAVRGDGARFFNQRWTGGFHRHTRHDGAGSVSSLSRNGALPKG
jgi:hypothetical protein